MPRFSAPSQHVAHERIEDEVIAINLTTGTYFSMQGSAADSWSVLMSGADVEGVGGALAAMYQLDATDVRKDVEIFVGRLVEAGLLVEDIDSVSVDVALQRTDTDYAAPLLEKYDDMEELLLLDPIHEVDDAGWPVIPVEPG